jgi:peptidoglycan/xylan/chitin deacetylase (PgdA/CDA1 family)
MKDILSAVASELGVWSLSSKLIPRLRGRKLLAVFTWHRITANPTDHRFLARYDQGISGRRFRQQLGAIRQLFEIISLEEFKQLISGKSVLRQHSALLTFDDADSEFFTEVLPVLREKNLPALMFAPASYIGTGNVFWHLRITNAFNHISVEQWERARRELQFLRSADDQTLLSLSVKTPEGRARACQRTIWLLDRAEERLVVGATDELESLVGCDYTLGIKCLDWKQLAELEANGISVESHTVNHPKLTRISAELAKAELLTSKLELERRLNKKVSAICYPGGHFDETTLKLASEAGYQIGFTTRFGFCSMPAGDSQVLAIPRFDMRGDNKPAAERYLTKLVYEY